MIRDDFQPYWDGNAMLAPNPVGPNTLSGSGSDNANMFTSEFYTFLAKLGLLTDQDKLDYAHKVGQCISQNLLNRVPVGQSDGLIDPDDILGVANGCREVGNTAIPRSLLWGFVKHFGFLNNVNPGVMTWDSFMLRQPQLVAALTNAAFPSMVNPIHWLIRLVAFPFYLYAAGAIAIACIGAPVSDTDSRRLSWHLANNCKKNSFMCWLASLVWMRRLYQAFPTGLKGVAAIYYKPADTNPYATWWVT